jgi:hypothetical protein
MEYTTETNKKNKDLIAVRRLVEYTTETNEKNKDLMVHDPEGETYREDQSRMLCVRPVSGEEEAACKYVAARSG